MALAQTESVAKNSIQTEFSDLLTKKNLSVRFFPEAVSDWNFVCRSAENTPASFTETWTRYFEAYLSTASNPVQSLASVLYCDAKPIAVWPLYLHFRDGAWHFGSCGQPVAPPLFLPGVGERTEKEFIDLALLALCSTGQVLGISEWVGDEICFGTTSLWHRKLAEAGAKMEVGHELYLDLRPELATIRACFRKSYRSLINQGTRLWALELTDRNCAAAMSEFRTLHAAAAGRITRSEESWRLQEQAIEKGEAFLVSIRDAQKQMVGGGLFGLSRAQGHYAVGAYDRSLFDKPLGHIVQMRAIEYLKEKGATWYRIGARPYPSADPRPDEKELSIAYYKEGFASHSFLRLKSRIAL